MASIMDIKLHLVFTAATVLTLFWGKTILKNILFLNAIFFPSQLKQMYNAISFFLLLDAIDIADRNGYQIVPSRRVIQLLTSGQKQ